VKKTTTHELPDGMVEWIAETGGGEPAPSTPTTTSSPDPEEDRR